MKNTATIFVFVQDYKLNPYVEANVQIRDLDAKKWQTVSYDKNTQRFALRDLKPGDMNFEFVARRDGLKMYVTLRSMLGIIRYSPRSRQKARRIIREQMERRFTSDQTKARFFCMHRERTCIAFFQH